jgi:hypothetical protein
MSTNAAMLRQRWDPRTFTQTAMPDQTTRQIQGTKQGHEGLLSDDATLELIVRARTGDRMAVEALLQRCLPPLKR